MVGETLAALTALEDDFDHIQELVEHVCRSNQSGDSRSANLAKVSAEILG